MYGYVYKITNLVNGKIYIGQHKSESFDSTYYGSGNLIKAAIAKYGIDNFKLELVECLDSKHDLDTREVYWIRQLNSQDMTVGYNIADGGNGGDIIKTLDEDSYKKFIAKMSEVTSGSKNGFYGRTHTQETKDKISKANTGRKIVFTEEHRRKLSEAGKRRKYKPLTDKQKKKLSKSLKGKNTWSKGSKKSEETRLKNSLATRGSNNPRALKVICLDTMKIYDYINQAQEDTRCSNISAACKGKQKTSGGLHWMYYDEYLKKGLN